MQGNFLVWNDSYRWSSDDRVDGAIMTGEIPRREIELFNPRTLPLTGISERTVSAM